MKQPFSYCVSLIVFTSLLYFSNCKNIENKGEDIQAVSQKVTEDSKKIFFKGVFTSTNRKGSSREIVPRNIAKRDSALSKIEIDYYPNGKVHKWKRYLFDTIPECIVYYDTNGAFDTFKGNPWIEMGDEGRGTGKEYVDIVNPPNVNYVIILGDFYKHKAVNELYYEPVMTDSCGYIVLNVNGEYKPMKEHEYLLYFYVMDSVKKELRRATIALDLRKDYFLLRNVPYHTISFEEYNEK